MTLREYPDVEQRSDRWTLPHIDPAMPEHEYHADPIPGGSLSHSGARRLLTTSPAQYRWERDHGGRPDSDAFDFGRAAHTRVLGTGAPIIVVQTTAKDGTKSDATDMRTKSAQEHRDEIRATGGTPLLAADAVKVTEMAAALLKHPTAAALLTQGQAEVSGFWRDEESGIVRRSRFDYHRPSRGGRLILVDYKSTVSADPSRFAKSCADYGYHTQHAWYRDGAIALGLDDDPGFLFVAQEKTPPYLVSVVQLDPADAVMGQRENRIAIDRYAACVEANDWPGYGDDITVISLPRWYSERTTA